MAEILDVIKNGLNRLTNIQTKIPRTLAIILLVFTVLVGLGAQNITLQSDLSKLDPQDIPVTMLRNQISTDFNEFESIVILIELDSSEERKITDIRDPGVIRFIMELQTDLSKDPLISKVQSAAFLFPYGPPATIEQSIANISSFSESSSIFSRGYEWTIVFVEADVGGDSKKIIELNERVDKIISSANKPGGVTITTTGDAPLNSKIFTLLVNDAFFTMILSTILIFLLVVVLQKSFKKALIIVAPLILGLIWTVGTMGWLNIPITIATAAMGAMLLGLGVEYSIFLYSRFEEEFATQNKINSIKIAVTEVGSTLVSSGTTTLIGFLSLALSLFPVLADLGKTLAIGIFFMLTATVVASPLIIMLTLKETKKETQVKGSGKLEKIYRVYGKFVGKRPAITLLISLILTAGMFYSIGLIENQDVDFETILPEDLEEIIAFIKLNDEFGDDNGVLVHVSLDPQNQGSLDVVDIRDIRVIRYLDELENQIKKSDFVLSTSSIVDFSKDDNGFIINNQNDLNEKLENPFASELVSRGIDQTLLRITLSEQAADESDATIKDLKTLTSNKAPPAGVKVQLSGDLVVQSELDALNTPDSNKTSLIALLAIIVFLFILSRSLKSTFIPLITVVLAIIWTLGLTGLFRIPFNNITTSVITMIIGISIDFGLQVMNRFTQERKTNEKRKAMEETLTGILTPMVITVIAAVIGFRAMGLGQLKLMGDLGILMSFGIIASMVVAVTTVASIIVLTDRNSSTIKPKKEKGK